MIRLAQMMTLIVTMVSAVCVHSTELFGEETDRGRQADAAGPSAEIVGQPFVAPSRKYDRPPDIARLPATVVAKTRLAGGETAELSIAKTEIRFRPGTKDIKTYVAAYSVYVLSKDGKREVCKGSSYQMPGHPLAPSEPHDFKLAAAPNGLLGLAFVDDGMLHFAEVDPDFTKQFPRLKPEQMLGKLVWRGKNYYAEYLSALDYIPHGSGLPGGLDTPLEAVTSHDGRWSVRVEFNGKSYVLVRESVGKWKLVQWPAAWLMAAVLVERQQRRRHEDGPP